MFWSPARKQVISNETNSTTTFKTRERYATSEKMLASVAVCCCSILLPAAGTLSTGQRVSLATPRTLRLSVPSALVDGQSFEPVFNPAQASALLAVVALPFGYWWYITVPEARIKLAKDKRLNGGEARAYLEDLASSPDSRVAERWFFSKWLKQIRPAKPKPSEQMQSVPLEEQTKSMGMIDATAPSEPTATRMPSGKTSRSPSVRELFQPASLKGNPTPRFWSGDNPIVVTMGALLSLGIIAAGARENAALTLDLVVLAAGVAFGVSRLTLD